MDCTNLKHGHSLKPKTALSLCLLLADGLAEYFNEKIKATRNELPQLLPTHLLSIGIFSAFLPINRWILHAPLKSQPCTVDLPQSALIYSIARLHHFSTFTPKHGLFLQLIFLICIQTCFHNLERNKLKILFATICPQTAFLCFASITSLQRIVDAFPFLSSDSNSRFIRWPCLYLVFFFPPKYLTLEWPQSTLVRTFPYLFVFLWWSQF